MRVLYIDIDCLRPDHIGAYGYDRPTTPVLDSIAARGVRFENCHTSDAPCMPSRAALFTGQFGIVNGAVTHIGPASQLRFPGFGHATDSDRPMWMQVLQRRGWRTASFSGFAPRHLAWWYGAGFTDNFSGRLPGHHESAAEVGALAGPWLREHGADDNWFAHVQFFDAHTPYWASQSDRDRVTAVDPAHPHVTTAQLDWDREHWYGPRTATDWWTQQPDWRNAGGQPPSRGSDLMPTGDINGEAEYRSFVDGYDAGVLAADTAVGELLAILDDLGVRDEVAVVVSSDHGESIGELGMYFEHGNAAEGTTRVPLIIDWPGVTVPGGVIDGLAYQLDLPPTMLSLIDEPAPSGWHGRDWSEDLRDPERGSTRDHLVCGVGIYSWQRAVRTERYRLIRTLHSGLYPYDDVYLFDMLADPDQRHDLSRELPEVVAELDHLLLEWILAETAGPAGVVDPFVEQLAAGYSPDIYCDLPRMLDRLESTGRHAFAEDLRRRRAPRARRSPLSLNLRD